MPVSGRRPFPACMAILAGREDAVVEKYVAGASARQLALQFGVGGQTIRRLLDARGIAARRGQMVGQLVPMSDVSADQIVDALTSTELAYIAGLIDGEGCLLIYRKSDKRGSRHFRCIMRISNTSIRVVDWLQARLGGQPANPKPSPARILPVYHWPCEGPRMAALLKAVMPYLVIKPELAQLLIDMQRQLNYASTGLRLPPEAVAAREELFASYQLERKEMRGR